MVGSNVFDRLPPQSLEAEQAVLGAILLESEVLFVVLEQVQIEDFYDRSHQIIFSAMIHLHEEHKPIDIITLTSKLKDSGDLDQIGSVSYLAKLAQGVPTAANSEYYAKIIQQKSMMRRLIRTATQIVNEGYTSGDNVSDLLNDAERRILEVSSGRSVHTSFVPIREVLMNVFERVETLHLTKDKITGVSSGFVDLDKMTNGFQNSDFIIVAARPSVGKTAFALNIAQNVAIRTKQVVAIFSLEMPAIQLVQRMICAEANLDGTIMRNGDFKKDEDWKKLTMGIAALSEAEIYIDDSPTITVTDIRSKCRRLKKQKGLGMVIIDYLQLIQGRGRTGENRQQEVSDISRTLKQLGREMEVPIIALSQLSRGVEQRQDKRPIMSDLRESGSIEQDADIVTFLYRDDYYNQETEKKNIIEIIIAKHRNGPVGTVELVFLKQFNKFVNYERLHSHENSV